jgi:cell filamentation protein
LTSYGSFDDPYCYRGSGVLRNVRNIQILDELEAWEVAMVKLRLTDPLPDGSCDTLHYRAVHRHLFQDVYEWAGQYRTVRIAKPGAMFCFPEHIDGQMGLLFAELTEAPFTGGAPRNEFVASAARFVAELNAIHPFREGNGRTQLTFLFLLGDRAGHPLDMALIRPDAMLAAMVESFGGSLKPLENEIALLLV